MSESNKVVLGKANAAILEGNIEGFLAFCADDITWTTVGDSTLDGKEAVRQWMKTAYLEPPEFTVANMLAEGDFVVALGDITVKDEDGKSALHSYSDVWRFRDGKMVELNAFVVKQRERGGLSARHCHPRIASRWGRSERSSEMHWFVLLKTFVPLPAGVPEHFVPPVDAFS